MNKSVLISICHKKTKETGLSFNQVMIYFFVESILKQLSEGKYRDKFIFKGGFMLLML